MQKSFGGRIGRLILAWVLVLSLDGLALVGLGKITVGEGLERVFEGTSARYAEFVDAQREFPTTNTLLVLLEADDFAVPETLAAVTDLVLDLQLAEGVLAVVSPFALPFPDNGNTGYLSSPGAVTAVQMTERMELARAAQPEMAQLLSGDRASMLLIVEPDISDDGGSDLTALIAEADSLAVTRLAASGIRHSLAGHPLVQAATTTALIRDFTVLNILGATLGTLFVGLALRSVVLAALTAMISGTGLLWAMGLLGWFGVEINVISIALPVLVLVLCFADTLHLAFDQRPRLRDGQGAPIARTLMRIAPACVLTSVTTAIAFLALTTSDSALISDLGRIGALAVLSAVAGVLVAHSIVYATAARLVGPDRLYGRATRGPVRWLDWSGLSRFALRCPARISLVSVAVTIGAVAFHSQVEPRFSLHENLSQDHVIRQTLTRIEDAFGPVSTMEFMTEPSDQTALDTAREASALFAQYDTTYSATSLATLDAAAVRSGMAPGQILSDLPEAILARLVSPETGQVHLSVPFAYTNSAQTRETVTRLEAALEADPGARALGISRATGFEVMSAYVSEDMLHDLNRSLLIALAASGLLVAIWLRSVTLGLIALVPNLLPVALVGAWLFWSGAGLQFTSGIALTLAFGLAIDDTLHVLNRLRLHAKSGAPGGATGWATVGALSNVKTIARAMKEVAPVLVISSIVLSVGMAGTLAATLPTVAYFGKLSIVVFALALIADLMVLPALLHFVSPARGNRR